MSEVLAQLEKKGGGITSAKLIGTYTQPSGVTITAMHIPAPKHGFATGSDAVKIVVDNDNSYLSLNAVFTGVSNGFFTGPTYSTSGYTWVIKVYEFS